MTAAHLVELCADENGPFVMRCAGYIEGALDGWSHPVEDGPKSAAFRNGVAQFGMALLPPQKSPGIHG